MKLLVSVTNLEEAIIAYECKADIIDVKNPEEGSLGASHPNLVRKIRDTIGKNPEISVTLGDLPYLPGTASFAALGAISAGANYVKAGLRGCNKIEYALKMSEDIVKAAEGSRAKVILSAYADFTDFDGLNPSLLPKIAKKVNAEGILVDILHKGENKVFHYLNEETLALLSSESSDYGIISALAGGLEKEDVPEVSKLGFSILGVRRAVCRRAKSGHYDIKNELVSELLKLVRKNDTKGF